MAELLTLENSAIQPMTNSEKLQDSSKKLPRLRLSTLQQGFFQGDKEELINEWKKERGKRGNNRRLVYH